jgi:hypothetical protein
MKGMVISVLIAAAAVISLTGCSDDSDVPNEPTTAVRDNIRAMEEENLEEVMATIHKESPSYSTTETLAQQLFDVYDLKYELNDVVLLEKNEEEAKVRCVQITTKRGGPAFRDNKILMTHVLKKEGNRWKLWSSQAGTPEFLN